VVEVLAFGNRSEHSKEPWAAVRHKGLPQLHTEVMIAEAQPAALLLQNMAEQT